MRISHNEMQYTLQTGSNKSQYNTTKANSASTHTKLLELFNCKGEPCVETEHLIINMNYQKARIVQSSMLMGHPIHSGPHHSMGLDASSLSKSISRIASGRTESTSRANTTKVFKHPSFLWFGSHPNRPRTQNHSTPNCKKPQTAQNKLKNTNHIKKAQFFTCSKWPPASHQNPQERPSSTHRFAASASHRSPGRLAETCSRPIHHRVGES